MDKRILMLALCMVVVAIAACVYLLTQQAQRPPEELIQNNVIGDGGVVQTGDYPLRTIGEMKQGSLAPGKYSVEGYLVYEFYCPPCPEGAMCIPCPGEYIIISDKNEARTSVSDPLNPGELPVTYMDDSLVDGREQGKRYRFKVEVTGDTTSYHAFGEFKEIVLLGSEAGT